MTDNPPSRKRNLVFMGVLTILIIFRIWLILGIPKYYIYAPHDDLYYAKAAHYIINGEWMGPYNEITLIKSPFYAFFLIASFVTGLPLLLNENIFYILACFVCFIAIKPLIPSRWWRLFLFVILLYSPACLITDWTIRVYREFVYISLTLFVVAFSVGFLLRIEDKLSSLFLWATGLGLSMGAFMICREEGIWIYPMMFLFLGGCLVIIWKKKLSFGRLRMTAVIRPVLLWMIPILTISSLNYSHYHYWGITENLDKNLNRVLNSIFRIKSSEWKPYKPITKEVLNKAYAASPLMDELKPFIEPNMEAWRQWSDNSLGEKPDWYLDKYFVKGKELAGNHFAWLFRSALNDSGKNSNGEFPATYLKLLADQLEAACDTGKLDCYPSTDIPLVGSMKPEQIPLAIHFYFDDIYRLFMFDRTLADVPPLDLTQWNSDIVDFKYFDEFAYNPIGSEDIGKTNAKSQRVGKSTDIRLRSIYIKQHIMTIIQRVYKSILFPLFLMLIPAGILILVYRIMKKRVKFFHPANYVFLFLLGLFISRIAVLALLDATTSVPAIHYVTSTYIFIFTLIYLLIHYVVENALKALPVRKPYNPEIE